MKFKYQVAAQLGETAWAGWDSANPSLARWNAVKYANTYRVVLYDDQGSVVSQLVAVSYTHLDVYKRQVEELCNRTSEDMMKVRNLGRKSLEEVLAKLKELGLQLNPSDDN